MLQKVAAGDCRNNYTTERSALDPTRFITAK
jgi:hypothetical protein